MICRLSYNKSINNDSNGKINLHSLFICAESWCLIKHYEIELELAFKGATTSAVFCIKQTEKILKLTFPNLSFLPFGVFKKSQFNI